MELLIYQTAYERVRAQLDPRIVPLVMDHDGTIQRAGEPIDASDAKPEAAWANRDLYTTGPVRDFMVCSLKSKSLRWLQTSAAGFDHPVFAKLVGNGVTLTNANASAVPIAEFVMAQVLSAFHPTVARLDAQAARSWQLMPFRDIDRSQWLIFGFGNIGAEIATRARAFGAKVTGCRRRPRGDEPVDEMISDQALLEHLPKTDVVVLAAALNDETRHTVDEGFLNALKPGATLVNIGRGGLVDEAALVQGLSRDQPGLAILDVFEEEPLPAESPFWAHPMVRVTAHCAGASQGTSDRGDEIFLENLQCFLDGEPLSMVVTDLAG